MIRSFKLIADSRSCQSQLKTTYRAIQAYQDTSGVHWDTPEIGEEVGRGVNIMSDAEGKVWQLMIDLKVHCFKFKKSHP